MPQVDRVMPYGHQPQSRYGRPHRREPQHPQYQVPVAHGHLNANLHQHFPNKWENVNFLNNQLGYPRPIWKNRNNGPTPGIASRGRSTASVGEKRTKRVRHKKNKKPRKERTHTHQNEPHEKSAEYRNFSTLVRQLFNLIRAHHHLENVGQQSKAEPPTFTRLTNYLTEVVKPANPTTLTKTLLEGNARNWAYTTRLILRDHYEAHIAQEVKALQNMDSGDVTAALGIATKWYHKRYPKKHTEGPVRSVEVLLKTLGDNAVSGEVNEENNNTIEEEALFTEEDFPPLPQREGSSSGQSSPWGPSPFPITLPPRSPRRKKEGTRAQREANPVVAHVESHPELFQIELCPNTQTTTSSPLIHEPQVEALVKTPALVEVHAVNTTSPLSEGTDQDPQIILVDELDDTIPESPKTPTGAMELDQLDTILSPLDPLGSVPREDRETSLLPDPPIEPLKTILTSSEVFRPVRHVSTNRKMVDWSFSARKPVCILGDSNLSRITGHTFKDLQIDSYPGGTFRHAENVIHKATVHVRVQSVLLAFGINHRGQKCRETAVKQMQRAIKAAADKFPGAAIWIPLINFSKSLKLEEQEKLAGLNNHIKRNLAYVPLLPASQFKVTQDKIHWTPACAIAMLEHWAKHLNLEGL